VHAVAVELDLMQPVGPVQQLVDKLGELRPRIHSSRAGETVRSLARYLTRRRPASTGYSASACASARWSISPTCFMCSEPASPRYIYSPQPCITSPTHTIIAIAITISIR
jgi:hypothetical protein